MSKAILLLAVIISSFACQIEEEESSFKPNIAFVNPDREFDQTEEMIKKYSGKTYRSKTFKNPLTLHSNGTFDYTNVSYFHYFDDLRMRTIPGTNVEELGYKIQKAKCEFKRIGIYQLKKRLNKYYFYLKTEKTEIVSHSDQTLKLCQNIAMIMAKENKPIPVKELDLNHFYLDMKYTYGKYLKTKIFIHSQGLTFDGLFIEERLDNEEGIEITGVLFKHLNGVYVDFPANKKYPYSALFIDAKSNVMTIKDYLCGIITVFKPQFITNDKTVARTSHNYSVKELKGPMVDYYDELRDVPKCRKKVKTLDDGLLTDKLEFQTRSSSSRNIIEQFSINFGNRDSEDTFRNILIR
jgi:hypothetical protein